MPPDPASNLHFQHLQVAPVVQVFFFLLCLPQSVCHLLKTLLTTQFSNLLPGGMSPDPLVTYTYTFGACKLRLWCKFFFLHCLLQSFCHLPKTLMTTWHVLFNTSFLYLMPVLLAVCTFPTFFCFQNQR